MTKGTKYFTIISTGAVAIALTLVLYFMTAWGMEADEIRKTSLGFVLFSEIAFFTAALAIAHKSNALSNEVFVWAGFTTALGFYWLLTIVMALLGILLYENPRLFRLHEIIALALTAAAMIAMYAASSHINRTDARAADASSYMYEIENRLRELSRRGDLAQYGEKLEALYENVKYSDKSKACAGDESIESALSALEDMADTGDAEALEETIAALDKCLRARSMKAANAGRGGF